MQGGAQRGQALVACLGALALVGLLAVTTTSLRSSTSRASTACAARQLGSLLRSLQQEALARGAALALVFPGSGSDEPLRLAEDGDGDGIRRDDLRTGRDPACEPFTVGRDHPGVHVGPPPWPGTPDPVAGGASLGPDSPAVRFGSGRAAVFTPRARARAGSFFVTDGRNAVCALVVHGATGRVRILCFDRGSGAWREPSY